MNKLNILSLVLIIAVAGACKKKEGDKAAGAPTTEKPATDKPATDKPATPPPAAVKLAPVDLTPVGEDWAGWTIQAPEGVAAKDSFGAAEISNGTTFNLEIRTTKGDIEAYKKESAANDINVLKRYVLETPDALIYESEVMRNTEFHLYGNVTVGDKTFNCEDVKGPRHAQADAEAMWKACQSLAKK